MTATVPPAQSVYPGCGLGFWQHSIQHGLFSDHTHFGLPSPMSPSPVWTRQLKNSSAEPLPDDPASDLIAKGKPGHPAEEAPFGRFYPGPPPLGQDPHLVTRGEEWECRASGKARASTFGSALSSPRRSDTKSASQAGHLSTSRSILPCLVNQTPRYSG